MTCQRKHVKILAPVIKIFEWCCRKKLHIALCLLWFRTLGPAALKYKTEQQQNHTYPKCSGRPRLSDLTLTMLLADSADDNLISFLIVPENRICHFMHIWQFAWSVKFYFLRKIRKIFQNVICWNFLPAFKVLTYLCLKSDSHNEPANCKTYDKTCATSKVSDLPMHLCSLIRVFSDHSRVALCL